MESWSFVALGTPGPQGSKSFKGMRGGHAVMAESSAKVAPWREAVKAAAPDGPTLDGPLAVFMVFTLKKPVSARKTEFAPCRTPDLSKLCRSTEDAITDAGLWTDDARVVEYARLAKVWHGHDDDALYTPGVVVAATQVGDGWPRRLHEEVALALRAYRQTWKGNHAA